MLNRRPTLEISDRINKGTSCFTTTKNEMGSCNFRMSRGMQIWNKKIMRSTCGQKVINDRTSKLIIPKILRMKQEWRPWRRKLTKQWSCYHKVKSFVSTRLSTWRVEAESQNIPRWIPRCDIQSSRNRSRSLKKQGNISNRHQMAKVAESRSDSRVRRPAWWNPESSDVRGNAQPTQALRTQEREKSRKQWFRGKHRTRCVDEFYWLTGWIGNGIIEKEKEERFVKSRHFGHRTFCVKSVSDDTLDNRSRESDSYDRCGWFWLCVWSVPNGLLDLRRENCKGSHDYLIWIISQQNTTCMREAKTNRKTVVERKAHYSLVSASPKINHVSKKLVDDILKSEQQDKFIAVRVKKVKKQRQFSQGPKPKAGKEIATSRCPREEKCAFKHDPKTRHRSPSRDPRTSPVKGPRNDSENPNPTEQGPSGKDKQTCLYAFTGRVNAKKSEITTVDIRFMKPPIRKEHEKMTVAGISTLKKCTVETPRSRKRRPMPCFKTHSSQEILSREISDSQQKNWQLEYIYLYI